MWHVEPNIASRNASNEETLEKIIIFKVIYKKVPGKNCEVGQIMMFLNEIKIFEEI